MVRIIAQHGQGHLLMMKLCKQYTITLLTYSVRKSKLNILKYESCPILHITHGPKCFRLIKCGYRLTRLKPGV